MQCKTKRTGKSSPTISLLDLNGRFQLKGVHGTLISGFRGVGDNVSTNKTCNTGTLTLNSFWAAPHQLDPTPTNSNSAMEFLRNYNALQVYMVLFFGHFCKYFAAIFPYY